MTLIAAQGIPVTRASNVMGRRLDLIKTNVPPFLAVVTAMFPSTAGFIFIPQKTVAILILPGTPQSHGF